MRDGSSMYRRICQGWDFDVKMCRIDPSGVKDLRGLQSTQILEASIFCSV